MNFKLFAAVLAIAVVPISAQAATKVTKADAQRVVKMISSDKAKTKIYCDMSKIGQEIDQADQKKDTKKVDELSQKMDDMSKQLGPEYVSLMDGLQAMNADSKEAQDIGDVLDGLDKLCGK